MPYRETLVGRRNLAMALWDAGRLKDALPLLEDAVTGLKKQYGLADAQTRRFQTSLADLYERLEQADRATALRRELDDFKNPKP